MSTRTELTRAAGLIPCHTYSIVARDPVTGQIGIAVQSHYFCVGAVVPWAEAGVGAVAAEAEGGDIRGRQSAALLVVEARASGRLVDDKAYDVRVDDAREPVTELRRLVDVSRAYHHLRRAQSALTYGDSSAMSMEFEQA